MCRAPRRYVAIPSLILDDLSSSIWFRRDTEDDIGGLLLLALAAKKLKTPYLASGGIGDGRGKLNSLSHLQSEE